ncbi:Acg family FMN-binding oxidoreductase [Nocardia sp. NPDC004068]|uniref:Acg family FMN-binding oxidoreductase n=1 Tax=Nocardia sp. NPDC004068 TaxID=3364303 RepID=UPI0036936109
MTTSDSPTTTAVPDHRTLLAVMRLAVRAPSVHNTQPWRWRFDGARLHLYSDPDRVLAAADPHGRQRTISCGAALHHARTAFAARGWHTDTVRLPDPAQPDHLAVIDFRPWPDPPPGVLTRAEAIERRRTDRLPMLAPRGWSGEFVSGLRRLANPHDIEFDVLGDDARPRLAAVSEHADAARHDDMMYQHELQWWTGNSEPPEGIPTDALVSHAEQSRVDVGRAFPAAQHSARRADLTDAARLAVFSTEEDAPPRWLRTGEALSAVLLEATAAGLATCPVTHITELPAGRRTVATLLPHETVPQVVLRIGTAPEGEQRPPTPRRPLAEVFEVRSS